MNIHMYRYGNTTNNTDCYYMLLIQRTLAGFSIRLDDDQVAMPESDRYRTKLNHHFDKTMTEFENKTDKISLIYLVYRK